MKVEIREKRQMWVRAVATAVAAWCVCGAAMAGGYKELWNPPEPSGNAAKHAVAKAHPARGSKGASKGASKVPSKTASKAAWKTAGPHTGPRIASAPDRGDKSKTRGGSAHVSTQGANKAPGAQAKSTAAVVAQSKKAHPQVAQAKSSQAGAMNAKLVQDHGTHGRPLKVAGKERSGTAKPAVAAQNAPVPSANVSAHSEASANPATARSGSLPPILR